MSLAPRSTHVRRQAVAAALVLPVCLGLGAASGAAMAAPVAEQADDPSDPDIVVPDTRSLHLRDAKLKLNPESVEAAKAGFAKTGPQASSPSLSAQSWDILPDRRQGIPGKRGGGDSSAGIGTQKIWPAYDDVVPEIYLKTYTLRGVGTRAQVWVADDRDFPAGDCRNTLGLNDITDAQVNDFIAEFDRNIHPKMSAAFSEAPARDGRDAPLADELGLPGNYEVDAEQAKQVVVLVDNIRDANFYEPTSAQGRTYVPGFFAVDFNDQTNRNVMTIDSFDWLHRTGANPPDNRTRPDFVACGQELDVDERRLIGTPRPRDYEGTFAHEYQHLLMSYVDPDEKLWVDEGLAEYAKALVGYVNPRRAPHQPNADAALACFAGFLPETFGGPENSLTLIGDQGGAEMLCDYGAASSFMQYLASHYGPRFLTALHRHPGNGLAGLDAVLDRFDARRSAMDTVHAWAVAVAVDAPLANAKPRIRHKLDDYTISTMNTRINWSNPQAYESPGAPPNGSDYVRFVRPNGRFLPADALDSIRFTGSRMLPTEPVEWTVGTSPEALAGECGEEAPDEPQALHSGCADGIDRSIARTVSVPAGGGELSFDAQWIIEEDYDVAAVQVSADGGRTWASLATQDTTDTLDPGADANVTAVLPGFNGASDGWRTQTADLSEYAGQEILLAFRYVTDASFSEPGLWVRDVSVADLAVPTDTLDGWRTQSEISPTAVAGYTVRLIAYGQGGDVRVHELKLRRDFTGELQGRQLRKALGRDATVVAAIVMQDDPSETVTKYAGYRLRVNGVLQPGG